MAKITKVEFIISSTSIKDAPVLNLPEFVVVGRSNVGKSSFINSICNRKNIAYVGKRPGKTRLINLFKVNDELVITDLPGYGFARRTLSEQEKWRNRIEEYLLNRKEIVSIIQLIDGRHDVQKNDFQMREWLEFYNIDIMTVVTKVDCISKSKVLNSIKSIEKDLNTEALAFSSKTGQGKDEFVKLIYDKIKNKKTTT